MVLSLDLKMSLLVDFGLMEVHKPRKQSFSFIYRKRRSAQDRTSKASKTHETQAAHSAGPTREPHATSRQRKSENRSKGGVVCIVRDLGLSRTSGESDSPGLGKSQTCAACACQIHHSLRADKVPHHFACIFNPR